MAAKGRRFILGIVPPFDERSSPKGGLLFSGMVAARSRYSHQPLPSRKVAGRLLIERPVDYCVTLSVTVFSVSALTQGSVQKFHKDWLLVRRL